MENVNPENKAILNPNATKTRKSDARAEPNDDEMKPFGRGACPKCGTTAEMANEPETGKVVYLHDCPGSRR